jgi:hypothetical protein
MNGYKSALPRVALGSMAAAMSLITIGSLVVLPAKFEHVSVDLSALALMNPVAMARGEAPVTVSTAAARTTASGEEQADPDCVALEAQASRAKRHKTSSHR